MGWNSSEVRWETFRPAKGLRKGIRNKKAAERRKKRDTPTQAQIEARMKVRRARAAAEETARLRAELLDRPASRPFDVYYARNEEPDRFPRPSYASAFGPTLLPATYRPYGGGWPEDGNDW